MKKVNIIDLRHYGCAEPPPDLKGDALNRFKFLQPPTDYGYVAAVITGLLLREQIGEVPRHAFRSQESCADGTLSTIRKTAGWSGVATTPLSILDGLSSIPDYDMAKIIADHEEHGGIHSIEHTAIMRDWSCMKVFPRSTAAFMELGTQIDGLRDCPDGSFILIISHGPMIETRFIRMIKLAHELVQLADQNWSDIDLTLLNGGMFGQCEGGIYRDVTIDDTGAIVGCSDVKQFRLPLQVTDLQMILK